MSEDTLKIGKFEFHSRLFTGTGKYPDLDTAKKALQASGCEVVTVAVRRVDLKATGTESIMTVLREGNYTIKVSSGVAVRTFEGIASIGTKGEKKLEVSF